MKYTIFTLLTIALYSCGEKVTFSFKEPRFKVLDKEHLIKADDFHTPFLSFYPDIRFLGKFKFTDTLIYLNNDSLKQYYHDARSNMIDDQHFNNPNTDTVSSSGLEFKISKKVVSTFLYKESKEVKNYYPAFIINNTSSDKIINGRGSRVFASQEAIDSSFNQPYSNTNYWFSISVFDPPMCGRGYWAFKLKPKEYAVILLPKYKGTYKTLIRARIKLNNSIFISEPYSGSISKNQFLTEDSSFYKMHRGRLDHYSNYFFDGKIKELSYSFSEEIKQHTTQND